MLAGEAELSLECTHDGEQVFSVLRTIREPAPNGSPGDAPKGAVLGAVLGAVEVMQPYDMLLAQVRRLEFELALQLKRRLAETEKLATVGTLAAGLAHELSARLYVISGRAGMLLGHQETGANAARHLHSIVAQSGRIARTMRSLLDYARWPLRRDDAVEFAGVFGTARDLLALKLLRAGVAVSSVALEDIKVRGDANQLQQVMTNRMLNAMQTMDGQSVTRHISVEAHPASTNPPVPSSDALITVSDTGPGLPAEVNGRLFTPIHHNEANRNRPGRCTEYRAGS